MRDDKKNHLKILLKAMIIQADEINDFTKRRSEAAYCKSSWDQKALAMSLQIIGENAYKISHHFPEYIQENPEIPWMEMRGLRNHISHGYDGLRQPRIWKIATESIPPLLEELREKEAMI